MYSFTLYQYTMYHKADSPTPSHTHTHTYIHTCIHMEREREKLIVIKPYFFVVHVLVKIMIKHTKGRLMPVYSYLLNIM